MSTTMHCPHCQEMTSWEHNPSRPFCSERCKLIDFGAWANESYQLPTEDAPSGENIID